MNAHALVADLAAQGLTVAVEGDRVKVRGPRELLTPEAVEALRARKTELLAALRRQPGAKALEAAGDLAEEVHRHCEGCRVCRAEYVLGEASPVPLCAVGRDLRRRDRDARREVLGCASVRREERPRAVQEP